MQALTMVISNNTDMDDPYTLPSSFTNFVLDASNNDIAIDLTYNNYVGTYYYFYRIDSSTYNVTITPKIGFTINGSTAPISIGTNQSCELLCITTEWKAFKYNFN
jgi:hypothetical protein